MKKFLITNAFGPQNRGDHELLSRLIESIEKNTREEFEISIFTSHPQESQREFGGYTSIKSPFFRPNGILESLTLLWDSLFWFLACFFPMFSFLLTKARKKKFDMYLESDVLIMCPGGYMYSNGLSLYVNIMNILPYRASKAVKLASPMSIGPFTKKLDYLTSKFSLSSLDTVFTRESYSFDLSNNMGLDTRYCHDLAWLASGELLEDRAWSGHYVGTVIDWDFPGLNRKKYRQRYISEYIKAINALVKASGKPFIIYNQVGNGDGTSLDEILISEIVEKCGDNVKYDNSAMDPTVLKSRMKYSKGVVASRFHSALFSIQVLCPLISISYQPKAEYILKDIKLEDICYSIESFTGEEIASKLIYLSQSSSDFSNRLNEAQKTTLTSIEQTLFPALRS
ncbi:polysaccharide pyruvyl transferase family protein [Vibrio coralliirubri]|uniref:polysaccharide pyruvyl transferase family protein n=1 Tax=Vibrio coralliirubri TaxID=1516159 RepID=UPI002FD67E07